VRSSSRLNGFVMKWHSHPGPVLVTVKSGALRVIYADDCTGTGTLYETGDTFVDRGDETVHIARNESPAGNVEFWASSPELPERV
jgi:quercetin dioxygenase-like cupin family protein